MWWRANSCGEQHLAHSGQCFLACIGIVLRGGEFNSSAQELRSVIERSHFVDTHKGVRRSVIPVVYTSDMEVQLGPNVFDLPSIRDAAMPTGMFLRVILRTIVGFQFMVCSWKEKRWHDECCYNCCREARGSEIGARCQLAIFDAFALLDRVLMAHPVMQKSVVNRCIGAPAFDLVRFQVGSRSWTRSIVMASQVAPVSPGHPLPVLSVEDQE